ncbi:hypothetical protein [Parafrankia sp. EUN1f]|uniref:hypothetical protein n=1 Tax=Parafrankia sp. EUN1f TaxID=102897 RepID=UPI0001C43AC8|nr:hypothetical protein [Parafrankia sp. EUN1f]EFC83054.1 hypothetical protein FrEUN1fDRAFT_3816 [Parafrankia sp. EUN1f]
MIAARLHANRDVRIEEVPEPEPAAGQVKIAVAHNEPETMSLAESALVDIPPV